MQTNGFYKSSLNCLVCLELWLYSCDGVQLAAGVSDLVEWVAINFLECLWRCAGTKLHKMRFISLLLASNQHLHLLLYLNCNGYRYSGEKRPRSSFLCLLKIQVFIYYYYYYFHASLLNFISWVGFQYWRKSPHCRKLEILKCYWIRVFACVPVVLNGT